MATAGRSARIASAEVVKKKKEPFILSTADTEALSWDWELAPSCWFFGCLSLVRHGGFYSLSIIYRTTYLLFSV
jgi:hypothetical protein